MYSEMDMPVSALDGSGMRAAGLGLRGSSALSKSYFFKRSAVFWRTWEENLCPTYFSLIWNFKDDIKIAFTLCYILPVEVLT